MRLRSLFISFLAKTLLSYSIEKMFTITMCCPLFDIKGRVFEMRDKLSTSLPQWKEIGEKAC